MSILVIGILVGDISVLLSNCSNFLVDPTPLDDAITPNTAFAGGPVLTNSRIMLIINSASDICKIWFCESSDIQTKTHYIDNLFPQVCIQLEIKICAIWALTETGIRFLITGPILYHFMVVTRRQCSSLKGWNQHLIGGLVTNQRQV